LLVKRGAGTMFISPWRTTASRSIDAASPGHVDQAVDSVEHAERYPLKAKT